LIVKTLSPPALSSAPIDEVVIPLPNDEQTPPVIKMNFFCILE